MVFIFFLKGIAVGAVIAVPVGPVGILCLRKTIFEGQLAGLVAGLGAASADAFFGIIAAFGLTFISKWLLGYESVLRAAGGCYLVYAGARALGSPPPAVAREQRDPETLVRSFATTFVLSITNPITILVFLGIFEVLGLSGARATLLSAGILVVGVWTGSLVWWLALVIGVGLFRRRIRTHHLAWVSRGSGAVLFLSGAALLATAVIRHLAHFV
ncbi:MAG: LysE family transporter [Alphaproteobacteria bacterium]|nr:LysE family transporter [Alphaproteobacteria bacterium]